MVESKPMTEKLENFNSMVKNIREDSSTFCLSLSRGQSSRASSMVGSVALAPKETVEQALLQLTTMAMDSFGLCSHGIRHLVRLWEMRPLRLRITSFALFGFERKISGHFVFHVSMLAPQLPTAFGCRNALTTSGSSSSE